MQDVAPVTNGGSDEDQISALESAWQAGRHQDIVLKWAGLWRTMILASLRKTLFPYSRFIRTLDLQDLGELLQEARFRNKLNDYFFGGDLAPLKIERESTYHGKKKSTVQLDPIATVNKLGEALIAQTPMLEELRGNIVKGALSNWIPKLTRLKYLNLWEGEALRDTGVPIRTHCPSFAELKFWRCAMASFLNEIKEQSLESLEIFSVSKVGPESFRALNCHRDSLTELHLHSIGADAMVSLNLLKGCSNIVSLQLSESGESTTDLEHRHNDVFLEIIDWLKECKRLKSLKLKHFFSAPSLLTPVLLEHDIKLIELELDEYTMTVGKNVHRALVHQPSLQSLFLKGEGDDPGTDGYNILVGSLCKLENLTELRLQNISDYFNSEHICLLAQNLPKLESFATTGWGITDEVWGIWHGSST
ncbi:hypothetical protein G7Y79_00040g077080 [Physcia stellaris]|nr:hypothetical protein G7Y79_00040g077080 [Physcia stellaris]